MANKIYTYKGKQYIAKRAIGCICSQCCFDIEDIEDCSNIYHKRTSLPSCKYLIFKKYEPKRSKRS
jgi:hypothetical protein